MMIRAVLAAALALTGGCGGEAFTSAAPAADVVELVDAGAPDARDLRATETAAAGSDDAALPDRQSDDAAAVFDVRADVVDATADVVDELELLDAGDAGDVAPWLGCVSSGCPACAIAGEFPCCRSSEACGCSSLGVCR